VIELFVTQDAARRHSDLVQECERAGVSWHLADAAALAALSETVSPQGIAAVCRFVDQPLGEVLAGQPSLIVVCARTRDPGNAGTLIRTADAVAASAVAFTAESVDPYNGKAVRASVGSLFHVPLVTDITPVDIASDLKRAGLQLIATDAAGPVTIDEASDAGLLRRPTAWLFGNEAWGMPADDLALADHVVRVPIHGRAESLNLATAAAVCLYSSVREQRRRSNSGLEPNS
jgi:RNA methyltransferase, TrmH family